MSKNYKFILPLFIIAICISFSSCSKKDAIRKDVANSNATDKDTSRLLKVYKKEGFISSTSYCVIIVKPSESIKSKNEIIKSAKNRAFSSIHKYLKSKGKRLVSQERPKLLNLVNDYGKLIELDDKSNSRVVYIYEIKKDNLINIIGNIGSK